MMTPKRMLFRLGVRSAEWLTLHSKPTRTCHLPLSPVEEKQVDIITVAFNNAELIRLQEQFLKKFIKDKYTHIVVDNSTDKAVREEIYRYCFDNGSCWKKIEGEEEKNNVVRLKLQAILNQ